MAGGGGGGGGGQVLQAALDASTADTGYLAYELPGSRSGIGSGSEGGVARGGARGKNACIVSGGGAFVFLLACAFVFGVCVPSV